MRPRSWWTKATSSSRSASIEVTQLYDGTWEKPHDPAFIKNASVDETKAGLKAAGLTEAYVPIPFTVTVVKMRGKTIMFEFRNRRTGRTDGGPHRQE